MIAPYAEDSTSCRRAGSRHGPLEPGGPGSADVGCKTHGRRKSCRATGPGIVISSFRSVSFVWPPQAPVPIDLTPENCALELISVDQYFGFPCSYALQYQHLGFKRIIEIVFGAHEKQTIRQRELQSGITSLEFAHYCC